MEFPGTANMCFTRIVKPFCLQEFADFFAKNVALVCPVSFRQPLSINYKHVALKFTICVGDVAHKDAQARLNSKRVLFLR